MVTQDKCWSGFSESSGLLGEWMGPAIGRVLDRQRSVSIPPSLSLRSHYLCCLFLSLPSFFSHSLPPSSPVFNLGWRTDLSVMLTNMSVCFGSLITLLTDVSWDLLPRPLSYLNLTPLSSALADDSNLNPLMYVRGCAHFIAFPHLCPVALPMDCGDAKHMRGYGGRVGWAGGRGGQRENKSKIHQVPSSWKLHSIST